MVRNRRHVVEWPNGQVSIIQCNSEDDDPIHERQWHKTLFELSRDGSDQLEHFDPAVHTLQALADGIPNHVPITQTEIDVSDLPASRDQRSLWRLVNGKVVPVGS